MCRNVLHSSLKIIHFLDRSTMISAYDKSYYANFKYCHKSCRWTIYRKLRALSLFRNLMILTTLHMWKTKKKIITKTQTLEQTLPVGLPEPCISRRDSAKAEPVWIPFDSLSILMYSREGCWQFQNLDVKSAFSKFWQCFISGWDVCDGWTGCKKCRSMCFTLSWYQEHMYICFFNIYPKF